MRGFERSPRTPSAERVSYVRPPIWFWGLFLLSVSWGAVSPNAELTCASLFSLAFFVLLLWRQGEPPILLFVIFMQWLQATLLVFYSDFMGYSVSAAPAAPPETGSAIWISLLGLLSLGVGMRVGMIGLKRVPIGQARAESSQLDAWRIWAIYLILFAVYPVLQNVAWSQREITQILIQIANLKWILFFLLVFNVLTRRKGYVYLFVSIALETVFGITGFFGGFKDPFFLLVVALMTVGYRFQARSLAGLIVAFVLLFHMSVLWTMVKSDYREYLNQGTREQTVLVSFEDRLKRMGELLREVDPSDYRDGIDRLVDRITYVSMFGYVLEQVPSVIPHENGKLWRRAIRHIFMPRLFFPEKPSMPSDSVITNYYTGLNLAGEEQGTSIGIGYVAETFIDFGVGGVAGVCFLLGVVWALMYQFFLRQAHAKLFGYAFSVVVLMSAYKLEVNNVFLLGGTTTGFLIFALILKLAEEPLHRLVARP